MARGSKDKYTTEQKHKAQHIAEGYEDKGVAKKDAEARAWATVNKQSGGAEKAGGSGAHTSTARKKRAQSDSAKRAAKTREGDARDSGSSLKTQSKESLLKEARSRNIAGRSKMSKDQLISALKK